DVFLAFETELAGRLQARFAAYRYEVVVREDFGADEAFLQVAVDDARRFGRGRTDVNGPRADFIRPDSEERLEAEQFVAEADHLGGAQLGDAVFAHEHLGAFGVKLRDFGFELALQRGREGVLVRIV